MPAVTNSVATATWRYRATLILFAAVAAAVVFWFQRHIEPFVTQTLIIGGTMSLWGLWKLGWSLYEGAGGEGRSDLTRRLLQNTGAVRALAFGAIIIATLHAFTSSVYIRYAGASRGEEKFTVRVLDGDKVFMGPFDIGPDGMVGRPMFPRWGTRELTYEIVSPRGYRTKSKKLSPWSSHKIAVPGDFERKRLHFLRIVPGRALYSDIDLGIYLRVNARKEVKTLNPLTRNIVVTGVTDEDLPDSTQHSFDTDFRQKLKDYYTRSDVEGADVIVGTLMQTPAQRLASAELAAGDDVVIDIGDIGADGQTLTPSQTCRFKVPSEGQYHTMIVGAGEKDCT